MQTKLTLRLEKQLVDSVKEYATSHGKSVSKMVADYFKLLKQIQKPQTDEIAPIAQPLKGVRRNAKVNVSDYKKYLLLASLVRPCAALSGTCRKVLQLNSLMPYL